MCDRDVRRVAMCFLRKQSVSGPILTAYSVSALWRQWHSYFIVDNCDKWTFMMVQLLKNKFVNWTGYRRGSLETRNALLCKVSKNVSVSVLSVSVSVSVSDLKSKVSVSIKFWKVSVSVSSGPTLWNSLPLSVRDPSLTLTHFCTRLWRLCYSAKHTKH